MSLNAHPVRSPIGELLCITDGECGLGPAADPTAFGTPFGALFA